MLKNVFGSKRFHVTRPGSFYLLQYFFIRILLSVLLHLFFLTYCKCVGNFLSGIRVVKRTAANCTWKVRYVEILANVINIVTVSKNVCAVVDFSYLG